MSVGTIWYARIIHHFSKKTLTPHRALFERGNGPEITWRQVLTIRKMIKSPDAFGCKVVINKLRLIGSCIVVMKYTDL